MTRDITSLLDRIEAGEELRSEQLLPLVYAELRVLARAYLSGERTDHTLQPTALVHEAYMKLAGPEGDSGKWNSKEHFIRAAAESMRRILVDSARTRNRLKRGREYKRVHVNIGDLGDASHRDSELLELHESLLELARSDPRAAELIQLRFFGGQTMASAAAILDISLATAERDWAYARAWLNAHIQRARS